MREEHTLPGTKKGFEKGPKLTPVAMQQSCVVGTEKYDTKNEDISLEKTKLTYEHFL